MSATPEPYDKTSVAWLRAANIADGMAIIYIQAVRLAGYPTDKPDPTWAAITGHQGDALTEVIKTLVPAAEWDYLWNHMINGGSVHRFDPSLFRKVKR